MSAAASGAAGQAKLTEVAKVLQLEVENFPKLLVKCRFESSGYSIHISDLSRIWRESLSKRECVERAVDIGCSIDPSQDDEQFRILLGKIESAFNRERNTTLQLLSAEPDNGDLSIKVSAALPKPLPPFEWAINLQWLDAEHLQAQLVLPLVAQASQLQHQMSQLLHELQDKDRVISKICDRLETSGNDLTTVFSGASNIKTSRKKGQREQLAKHVKGLGDFDEGGWRARSVEKPNPDGLTDEELNGVLQGLPMSEAAGSNDWWRRLNNDAGLNTRSKVKAGTPPPRGDIQEEDESMHDSMFQRQATPPHMQQHRAFESEDENANEQTRDHALAVESDNDRPMEDKRDALDDGESTTEDEDDLDAPPKRPVPTRPKQSPTPPKQTSEASPLPPSRKLGSIGGRKQPEPPHASPRKLGAMGGRSSPHPTLPEPKEPTPDVASPQPKARAKLGTIGGKAKDPTAATTVSTPSEQGSPPPAKGRAIGKIGGRIGGKSVKGSTQQEVVVAEPPAKEDQGQDESPLRSRAPTKEPTPQPRETSQERANRKRDQLKRDLEDKAKAPVKKKRKF
ncbi:uncharacterized protein LTR77_008784 [Saxophila tyrrhenica]|uniref:Non-homologous end-joining factor 1 n=1 Tax=Saxophila tyrrhenica TaxID=1690608 RepID=A0AAV9P0P9_9PEZI|nr:hypothetical protein LTR77_008784 [Saxophila tyrrhenica]